MKLQLATLALSLLSTAALADSDVVVGSVSLIPSDAITFCPGDIKLIEEHTYSEGGSVTKATLKTSDVKDVSVSFHSSTEKTVTWAVKFKRESFVTCKANAAVRMTTEDGGVFLHTFYKASFRNGTLFFTFDVSPSGDNGAITYQNIKNGDAVLTYVYAD